MGNWTNSSHKEKNVINGQVRTTKQQNSYSGSSSSHSHSWYEPKSGKMGYTGDKVRRNPNYR